MITATHPAASAEFLSRLHDGELTAAEREDFTRHAQECPTCRLAVEEFERSLTAFRSAPPSPVPTDLSARILRKIRAQSPSRRPFGVMFGIDIRWAGVFLAALLVAIIAPALLTRRARTPAAGPPEPFSAHIVEAPATDKLEAPRRNAGAPPAAPAQPRLADEGARDRARRETDRREAPPPPPRLAGAPEEKESGSAERQKAADDRAETAEIAQAPPAPGDAPASAPRALSRRPLASTERAGGEAGAFASEPKLLEAPRLDVRPLDGEGQPPELAAAPADGRLEPLRGREFIVIVQEDGRIRDLIPQKAEPDSALRKDAAAKAAPSAGASTEPLRELRFVPGKRPRRLLVRVQ